MSWQLPHVRLIFRRPGIAGWWKPPSISGRGAEATTASTNAGMNSSSVSGIGKRPGDQVDHLPFLARPVKPPQTRSQRW